jgi:hypothetical protein
MTTGRRWKDEDERLLVELRAAGKTWLVVSKQLGRTEAAVIGRSQVIKARMAHKDDE